MILEELKNYLRIRGLKVNRRQNELVAKVFAASEMVLNRSKLLWKLKLI